MNFNFQAGGSPLLSRQNPVIYLIPLFGAALIGIAFLFFLLIQLRKKYLSSEKYIEASKNRPTKKKDVIALAKKYSLSSSEIDLLWYISEKYKIPNILYMISIPEKLDVFFKDAYNEFLSRKDERSISELFELKAHLERIYAETQILTNTYKLISGTEMKIITSDGESVDCLLLNNTKDYLELGVDEEYFTSKKRAKELSHVVVSFKSKTGMKYSFLTRVVRYQRNSKNIPCVLIVHAIEFMDNVKRAYRRMDINTPCTFSAVKSELKKGKTIYEVSEKEYKAYLLEISGNGCKMQIDMPIKDGQFLRVSFVLDKDAFDCLGKISKLRSIKGRNIYNIYVEFINVKPNIRNKMLAKVYGYDV